MAATGTPTPNIGLRIPVGTDPASVDDINYNSNLIDTKLGPVGSDSVQDQIDALNSKIGNLLELVTVSGNTDSNGIFTTNIKCSDYAILSVEEMKCDNTTIYAFFTSILTSGGTPAQYYCFKFTRWNGEIIYGSIEAKVYRIKK